MKNIGVAQVRLVVKYADLGSVQCLLDSMHDDEQPPSLWNAWQIGIVSDAIVGVGFNLPSGLDNQGQVRYELTLAGLLPGDDHSHPFYCSVG